MEVEKVKFKWTPKAYVAIMRVDLAQANEEIASYSENTPREDQVYRIQEVLRFASKVAENAHRALQVLASGVSDEE